MRLAIVAASSYTQSGSVPELFEVEAQVELLRARLADPDAGFRVTVLPAERGLADSIENLLASLREPAEEVLFLFAGYVVVSEKGVPALLVDGERLSTLSLRRVRRLLCEHAHSSFVVLDTVTALSEPWAAEDVVAMCSDAVLGAQEDVGLSLLAANRLDAEGPSPFLNLLVLALDWHTGDEGLGPRDLLAAMQREEAMFAQIAHAGLIESAAPFQILLPRGPVSIPPSLPPPSREGAEERADALARAGDHETALTEYTAALEQAAPTAALYTKIGDVLAKVGRIVDADAYYAAAVRLEPQHAPALDGAATLREDAGDFRGALQLVSRRLRFAPDSLPAVERAARLHGKLEDWEGLATLYERVLGAVTNPEVSVDLARKLDELCADVLRDPDRATASLELVASLAPDDLGIRLRLARLLEDRKDPLRALPHLLAALRIDPGNVAGYRTAIRLFEGTRDPDGSWNAACALEVIGDADVNESLLASAHRPEGLLPVTGSLGEEHWQKRLLSPERDPLIDEIFAALGPSLVELGLETAARKRRMTEAGTPVDTAKSTATLVRMLTWSSRLLAVPVPGVHVVPDLPSAFLVPPTREPTLLVSKTLGTGLDMPELAFLWARQLVFLRPEHTPLRFFPTVSELSALLLATLSLGRPDEIPAKKLDGDAKLFARGLRRHVSKESLDRLRSLTAELPLRESTRRVATWARGVELAASRAGLLACGNLETAARMTDRFPLRSGAEPEPRGSGAKSSKLQGDVLRLLAYAVSSEYAALRDRIGVKLAPRPSTPPRPLRMNPTP